MALVLLRTPSSYSPPSATTPLLPFTTAFRSPSRVPSSAGHWKRVRGLRIASGSGRGLALTHADTSGDLKEIRDRCTIWKWKEFDVNYLVKGKGPPLLLVHGFGASVGHWRRNIGVLSECYTVYALDLLGFGASDKPPGFAYTMEGWAQLILDFLDEVIKKPTVLVGNSVGSLACVIAASESNGDLVRGLVLLNCAGGMNNKAVVDDWRIKLLLPLLWLFDFLLSQRVIASALFERVKQSRENLKNILLSVYGNKDAVDEDLIEIIKGPADDKGALDAFVSIVTGPPGPNPVSLMPKISIPVLVLWGDRDPFTPIDGPVGKYFTSLPSNLPNIELHVLLGVGHCPHDDRPDLVHEKLLSWLSKGSVSRLLSSSCELGLISARERAVFPSSGFGVCARDCDRFGNYKQRKKLDPMDGDRRRRAPLKSRHPDLKEKLRQCCLERIKEERNQLLWKIRSNRQQSQETENIVESTLREIVSDELQRMQPSLVENQRNIVSKNNDVIWEFDGLHLENSTETASEELMLEMQRLLYEDLREELIRRELEFFEKEDEYLAQAVLENMNLNENQNAENNKVWCPICKRGDLRENHHIICCTNCNLRFDAGIDKLNLNFLKSRLGEVHMDHLNRGCKATPSFCMQAMFNLNALFIQCEACDTFEIVI
ncbi:unnamed protein product [Musa hybrid cultivar]